MDVDAMTQYAAAGLAAAANPDKAAPMAAYMKTDMPFYGVQKADRNPIVREIIRSHPPVDRGGGTEELARHCSSGSSTTRQERRGHPNPAFRVSDPRYSAGISFLHHT